mmetsp:Transcript_69305/g.130716  ORF Transcript_69305/g.130716 Transcript_69305/m.130716 type:complete len:342 (-) Transcript_69305:46-1071(-)
MLGALLPFLWLHLHQYVSAIHVRRRSHVTGARRSEATTLTSNGTSSLFEWNDGWLSEFSARLNSTLKPWQLASGKRFADFLKETRSTVKAWPLLVARASTTDRVAVTVFQPGSEVDTYAQIIRWNLHFLGPKWAMQVFYGRDYERAALQHALGSAAQAIIWTPIFLQGKRREQINVKEYNFFRLSMDFWEHIKHEHVLIFEADSLVLRGGGCVESFFSYDYVGAPWHHNIGPPTGGNGGFTLRRRSTSIAALRSPYARALRGPFAYWVPPEDIVMTKLLEKIKANICPSSIAMKFAAESIDSASPCGFHKPWLFSDAMTERFIRQAHLAMHAPVAHASTLF